MAGPLLGVGSAKEENTGSTCKLGQILIRKIYNSRDKTRIYNDSPSDTFIPIRNKRDHEESFCKEIMPKENLNFILAEVIYEDD